MSEYTAHYLALRVHTTGSSIYISIDKALLVILLMQIFYQD